MREAQGAAGLPSRRCPLTLGCDCPFTHTFH
jgi:hypothetical protein